MRTTILAAALSLLAAGCFYDTRSSGHRDAGLQHGDSGGCGSLTDCDGVCADLASDPAHCGGCAIVCDFGAACVGGICSACTPSCEGRTCGDDGCGGSCGSCGDGQSCNGGVCGAASAGESCAAPTDIVTSGSYPLVFSGRSADHTPFSCGTTSGQPDLAFRVTPAVSGTATFETSGSIDTVMAVYSSASCTSDTELSCNDDSSGTNAGITLSVSAGITYYVVVAPYGSSTPTEASTLLVTLP